MSYWPQMFKGGNKFLLCTEEFNDIVLFGLDEDGAPTSFVSGGFGEVFVKAYMESHPKKVVLFDDDVQPWRVFGAESWQLVCDKLNSKKSSYIKTIWNNSSLCRGVGRYFVVRDSNTKLWRTTTAADDQNDGEDDE